MADRPVRERHQSARAAQAAAAATKPRARTVVAAVVVAPPVRVAQADEFVPAQGEVEQALHVEQMGADGVFASWG
jgi:hypothetical protein